MAGTVLSERRDGVLVVTLNRPEARNAIDLETAEAIAEALEQLDRDAALHHLNAVITWYRDATTKIKSVGLPSDAIYLDNARNLASEAVRLAFQSARAEGC